MGLEHVKKRKLSIKYGRRYKKKKKFEMDLKWFEHFSKTLKKIFRAHYCYQAIQIRKWSRFC